MVVQDACPESDAHREMQKRVNGPIQKKRMHFFVFVFERCCVAQRESPERERDYDDGIVDGHKEVLFN